MNVPANIYKVSRDLLVACSVWLYLRIRLLESIMSLEDCTTNSVGLLEDHDIKTPSHRCKWRNSVRTYKNYTKTINNQEIINDYRSAAIIEAIMLSHSCGKSHQTIMKVLRQGNIFTHAYILHFPDQKEIAKGKVGGTRYTCVLCWGSSPSPQSWRLWWVRS